jgi:hypothetical protein
VIFAGNGILKWNNDIRVLPGLYESHSAVAVSEGVRVVIHPSGTQPFPFTEGFDVPTGYSASFGIRPRRNIRIGQPHGNCCRDNPFEKKPSAADDSNWTEAAFDQSTDAKTNSNGHNNSGPRRYRYRSITCQKMCLQSHVVAQCRCYDSSLPILPELRRHQRSLSPTNHNGHDETGRETIKPCWLNENFGDFCFDDATDDCLAAVLTMYDRVMCARRTRDMVARNSSLMAQCGCHPPCDEFQYDVSYSLSKWPATGFEGDKTYYDIFYVQNFRERFNRSSPPEKTKSVWEYFRDEDRIKTMQDFARLNVYIADSSVIVTQETADYELNQLVSDIGGQLGIWVGMSVLTLSEVVELFYLLLRHFLMSRIRRLSRSAGHLPTPTTTVTRSNVSRTRRLLLQRRRRMLQGRTTGSRPRCHRRRFEMV